MKLRLTKQFDFQMAHTLSAYPGKCRNIHGHNYKLFVAVENEEACDTCTQINYNSGMLMDFTALKSLVENEIIEVFDHAFVVPQDSPYANIENTKKIVLPFQPTCENLLLYFATLLNDKLPEGVRLYSLKIHETETSFAELIL
ncbi:MAG: 6-carboxytetrahydropterin synthase [Bacteroidales bacterium]|nr:6-carboxytetrahydropterin synthase [Bacteroidales bacterium]